MLSYKESETGRHPARGHQRGRLGRVVHRRRHVVRHARRADDPDLHLLLDVRLPAHRRRLLGGRRPDDARLPARRHRRAARRSTARACSTRTATRCCSPRPTRRSSPTTRRSASRSATSSATALRRMYGDDAGEHLLLPHGLQRAVRAAGRARGRRRRGHPARACTATPPRGRRPTGPKAQLLASGVAGAVGAARRSGCCATTGASRPTSGR